MRDVDTLKLHKKKLAEEIIKLRTQNSKIEEERSKYHEALVLIKNSFYNSPVAEILERKIKSESEANIETQEATPAESLLDFSDNKGEYQNEEKEE